MGENIVFIQGKRIDLLVKKIENIKIYHKWVNNPIVRKYLSVEIPLSLEEIKKEWFPDYKDDKNIWFEIWHKLDQIPIGMIGLFKINYVYRTAEIGIFIGETNYWKKQFGTEAVSMIIDYAFNTLNIRKFVVAVNETNIQSLKMFEKIGFVEEGHLKDMEFINGKSTALKWLGMLKKDKDDLI
ncbi:MAG: GNAT family N-acetyltransferase [Promethearchaeota archaeon]